MCVKKMNERRRRREGVSHLLPPASPPRRSPAHGSTVHQPTQSVRSCAWGPDNAIYEHNLLQLQEFTVESDIMDPDIDVEADKDSPSEYAQETAEEGSPDSGDGDMTDPQTPTDKRLKNRSKRKPSKTQIKHIAPKGNENCDTSSKYGTKNIEELFIDVTQGIFHGGHSQAVGPQAQQPQKAALQVQPLAPARRGRKPSGYIRRTSSSSSSSSKPPPCYPCGICGKIFRVPSRYDSHMLGHSKGKPFCCNTCGKMFASQLKLDHHLPVHNCDRNSAFTCETCGKVCVNWRAYLYHLKAKHTESGGKRFSCNLCGRQFHTSQRLRNHMASHEIGKNHCCTICGKLFESRKKLDIHTMVHNLPSKHGQQLQCTDCGRMYSEWIAFKQHMKTHGAEGVRYPCGLCDMTFPTQYEKEKHKRVHKQVQCEFCERFFRSASVLSVHLRVHTGERPYKCGLCERDFSQASVLKVHMRTHNKDGRYECKRCGNVYGEVMEFFKHHMTHLEEGNLQCEECGKIFQNINNKNRHMAAHRDRVGRICHVCGKEFGRVSHLEAHMLCHSDQLPLLCKVCGKMFPSQEVLSAHYSSHMSGDISVGSQGPLFCGLCGKIFKDQGFLDTHMKKHEKESLDTAGGDKILDEDVIEVEGGQYACTDCGKAFGQEHHLKVHKREHTNECPHTCCMCGQSFMLRKQLLQHIGEHRRNGLMMYLNLNAGQVRTTDVKVSSQNRLNVGSLSHDTDTGSETETDNEQEDNENTSKRHLHQQQVYKQTPPVVTQQTPISFHENNRSTIQNHQSPAFHEDSRSTVQNHQSPAFQEENHSAMTNQQVNHQSPAFQEDTLRSHTSPAFQEDNHISVRNHQSPAFQEDNLSSMRNHHSPAPVPYSRSHQSPCPGSDSSAMQSGLIRGLYNTNSPAPGHSHISQSNSIPPHMLSGLSMNMKDEPYLHGDIQVAHRDMQTPHSNGMHLGLHLSMKNDGLPSQDMQHMLRPEPLMPSGLPMSSHHDFKNDLMNYTLPYNKGYFQPAMNNSNQLRSSFQTGFPGPPGRFSMEMHHPMTNFQLLPQTAFPENSQT